MSKLCPRSLDIFILIYIIIYICYIMIQKDTNVTEVVRIPSDLMNKIREISKQNGQTHKGYLTSSLYSVVNKDYNKLLKKQQRNAQKIHI
jgi:hypothetical protein